MSQRNVLLLILTVVSLVFVGLVAYDMTVNHRLQKITHPENNWQWDDKWTSDNKNPEDNSSSDDPAEQITATDYEDALKKAKSTGRPIFISFASESCIWCKKMQQTTYPDPKIKDILKKYVYLNLDADQNQKVAKKYDIKRLPAYVIINDSEKKIKDGHGFKDAKSFHEWLNNPELFNNSVKSQPEEKFDEIDGDEDMDMNPPPQNKKRHRRKN